MMRGLLFLSVFVVAVFGGVNEDYINSRLDYYGAEILALHTSFQNYYSQAVSEGGSCNYIDACPGSGLTLTSEPGFTFQVSLTQQSFKFLPGVVNVQSGQSGIDICVLKHALNSWKSNLMTNSPDLKFQYGATQTGMFSIFPGFKWIDAGSNQCPGDYDPRYRPYYASGASGPKDVVIVVDTSGSMGTAGRLGLAQSAMSRVLDTLTANDYIGLVQFNSAASHYNAMLQQGTTANKANMNTWINNLGASGLTDFSAGITKAFDMIALSRSNGRSSKCRSIMLFLTDGINTGSADPVQTISTLNNDDYNLILFSYSLGSGADDKIPKQMACDNKGYWTKIEDGGGNKLADAMANYFQYIAAGMTLSTVRWSAPYQDAFTTENIVSGSVATYDKTGSANKLFGLVVADVLTANLTKNGTIPVATVETVLKTRSSTCPQLSLSGQQVCEIEKAATGSNSCPACSAFHLIANPRTILLFAVLSLVYLTLA